MPRTNRPISVTLGELQSGVEAAIDEWLRQRVDEAFADPRPNVPAREVFKRLKSHHARRVKERRRKGTCPVQRPGAH